MNEYTIFMYIYDEYLVYKEHYESVNDFMYKNRISTIIKYYNENIKDNLENINKIHYDYYKFFEMNAIEIIQDKTNQDYIPKFRLLLFNKINETTFGVHRFGWKNVIYKYLKQAYYEYDEFYLENPEFEWVSYALEYNLDDYESAKRHFLSNIHFKEQMDYKKMKYIIFDEWLERKYLWNSNNTNEKPNYIYPFISFIHDPPYYVLPEDLFDKSKKDVKYLLEKDDEFLREKENLCILITMSHFYKKYITHHFLLSENTSVQTLYHPLELTQTKYMFDIKKFIENDNKQLFIIGWWLRRYDRFLNLSCKKCILGKSLEGGHVNEYITKSIRKIIDTENIDITNNPSFTQEEIELLNTKYNTKICDFIENDKYDTLFYNNIIFLDVYESVANNIVLECIMNNTPLLVNYNLSIVEYLGENYPFYFVNYEDAERKVKNLELITKTHYYLKNMDKTKFTYHYFNRELNKIIKNVLDKIFHSR
jgi:hypothetical protein